VRGALIDAGVSDFMGDPMRWVAETV